MPTEAPAAVSQNIKGRSHLCMIQPPFRSPHHGASVEGLLGGGKTVRPGEISLAHFGTLFLDEAPEFRTSVLKALREPLEDGVITIARAEGSLELPAEFQLILVANPCPCGRLGQQSPGSPSLCFCSDEEIHRHWQRLGSALLDRIEIRIPVLPEPSKVVGSLQSRAVESRSESSSVIAARVRAAIDVQRRRFRGTSVRRNARMGPAMVEKYCALAPGPARSLQDLLYGSGLSNRALHGILRLARTIADLAGRDEINLADLEEAVSFRKAGEDPYEVLNVSQK
ncbi:MAG: ATP-binding protein [Termitinemataceae bacterium]